MQSTKSIALARALRGACRVSSPTARHYHTTTRTIPTTAASLINGHQRQQQQQQHHQQQTTPTLQTHRLHQTRHYASTPPSTTPLRTTPLHNLHLAHGAKLVPFGGLEVALQGPEAEGILRAVLAEGEGLDLRKLLFGQSAFARVRMSGGGVSSPVLISRGGYTGEDGFEISIAGEEAIGVTEALLEAGGPEKVQFAGLGARDSLRLEAGMCLYGHDLDETTTPVEAGLSWIIPKERRTADAGYYGAEVIAKQLVAKSKGGTGVERRRVGLIVEGAPAREGAEVVSRAEEGKESVKLGTVTSGCPSPTLGKNIAMGYVKDGFHKAGTEVDVLVRGRPRKAVISKMPFVPTKYWKGDA